MMSSDHQQLKIVIAGGTGQVGSVLTRAFRADGHEVVVIGRHPTGSTKVVTWDGTTVGDWADEIDGADAVINLAGFSVNCRYNQRNRDKILRSRVDSVRVIGEAIRRADRPPRVWLQASTATIYAHRFDTANDETNGVIGGEEPDAPREWRFSIDVARAWEAALDDTDVPATRKVKMRSAMTMSPDRGGIFDTLLGLVRIGLGGTCGDGRQYVSWAHHEDFVRAVYWLMDRSDIDGVVNVASPNPLPNAAFMRGLRRAWGARWGIPAARWMLSVGALVLRTETELILKSRRVVPARLLAGGFEFRYPTWPQAAEALCREWRTAQALSRETDRDGRALRSGMSSTPFFG